MSGVLFWLFMGALFALLWWAGFYATKDMRVRKNAMREEQAKRNLELHAQQQAAAQDEEVASEETTSEDTGSTENKTPKDAS